MSKKNQIDIKCDKCGSEFQKCPSKISAHNFCSLECKRSFSGWISPNRVRVTVNCSFCGVEIFKFPSAVYDRSFCSMECKGLWLKSHPVNIVGTKYIKHKENPTSFKKGNIPALHKEYKDDGIFFNTKPEKEMKRYLDELGIKYEFQIPVNIKHCYVADFYLPLYNTIIEVDGKWFHNYPDGREIDRIRTQELEETGYRVLRFWENEFDARRIWGEI